MKFPLPALSLIAGLILSGCVATPVERSGGPGSITIPNTSANAIANAARQVFPRYGFTTAPSRFPEWIAFQRPAGRTGQIMFGGFHGDTAIRARLTMSPIHGTRDFRVIPQLTSVRNAGRAGFESETPMLFRSWNSQLRPILREIQTISSNSR